MGNYTSSPQLPRLHPVVGKLSSSTNFNKLQVFIIAISASLTQALHQVVTTSIFAQ